MCLCENRKPIFIFFSSVLPRIVRRCRVPRYMFSEFKFIICLDDAFFMFVQLNLRLLDVFARRFDDHRHHLAIYTSYALCTILYK